jgi:hypothetical protein
MSKTWVARFYDELAPKVSTNTERDRVTELAPEPAKRRHSQNAGDPLVERRHVTQKVRLERHHAGIDDEQVGIIEDQRCARNDLVPAGSKAVLKALAQFMVSLLTSSSCDATVMK